MRNPDTDSPSLYVVRNEPDPDAQYHCDAVADQLSTAEEVDFVAGERFPLDDADGVVLTGSSAGVYEADSRPWIAEEEALVRDLVEREIPTLGVCFGHQVVNSALGGTVEAVGTTEGLVEASLDDDPLFEGVDPVVVSLHGDQVTTLGTEMDVIASADHAEIFGTRHRTAPLWTVQFHPELTDANRDRLEEKSEWEANQHSFEDLTAPRVFENFRSLVSERTA